MSMLQELADQNPFQGSCFGVMNQSVGFRDWLNNSTALRFRQAEPGSMVKKLAGQTPGVGLRVLMAESLFKYEMLTEQNSDLE